MGQSFCDKTRDNKTKDDGGDHQVVKVIFDQIKPLAGSQPGPVQVEAVHHHDDSGLEAAGGGDHPSDGLHPLLVVEDTLMGHGELGDVGGDAGLPQVAGVLGAGLRGSSMCLEVIPLVVIVSCMARMSSGRM